MRQSFIEKTQTHQRRRIVFSPPIIPLRTVLRCYYDVMLLRFKVVRIDMHIQMFECCIGIRLCQRGHGMYSAPVPFSYFDTYM